MASKLQEWAGLSSKEKARKMDAAYASENATPQWMKNAYEGIKSLGGGKKSQAQDRGSQSSDGGASWDSYDERRRSR